MKYMLLSVLWFSMLLSFAYAQEEKPSSFETIKKENGRLSKENKGLRKNQDLIVRANKRQYGAMIKDRDRYRDLYYKEKSAFDSLVASNNRKAKNDSITRAQNKSGGINTGGGKAEGNLKGYVLENAGQVDLLKDKLKDCISVREKKIHYKGDDHGSGKEMMFIHFNGENPGDKIKLTELQIDSLERIINLVSKYTLGVKIKLEGECSKIELKAMGKKVAIERAKKLRSYLDVNHPLDDLFFNNIGYNKNPQYRKGISIRIYVD